MLFWLMLIVLGIGIAMYYVSEKNRKFDTLVEFLGIGIISISALGIILSTIVLIRRYTTADSYLEKNREIYKGIVYKVESGACRDEFGLLNKEIIDEIQEWNKDLVYYQSIQDNFWVGIYYPNVYDEFEKIEYDSYK